jgi:hypothetical protein
VVQSHFHDAIAGCAHDRVAEEARGRLADAADAAREIVRAALDDLTGHDPDAAGSSRDTSALVVWNPTARRRGGVVIADLTFFRRDVLVGPPGARLARSGKGFHPFALRTGAGESIPVQVIEVRRALERRDARRHYPDLDEVDAVRVAFTAPEIGGMSLATLGIADTAPVALPEGRVTAGSHHLANEYLDVRLADDGTLDVTDLRSGARLTRLLSIVSESDLGDTYSFAPGQGEPTRSRARVTARMLAAGPLVGILAARWDDLEASFGLRVELRSGEPFVRASLEIENRGVDRRLRAHLPTGASGLPVVVGAAFGWERRAPGAPVRQAPAESPVATAPAHRFLCAAGPGGGLALLVPGHCEYEWQRDGTLLLTLLRSVGQLSRNDLATRPGHAGWPTSTPGAQCPGADRVTFAIAPIALPDASPDRLHELWETAFLPPSTRWLRDTRALRTQPASIELDGEGLVLSAVKPAENGEGIVLRCWNAADTPTQGTWLVVPPPSSATLTRADETVAEAMTMGPGGTIPFTAGPRAMVTVRVT